jgi:hypothetical protein
MYRMAVVVCAALLLSACGNMVRSDEPVLVATDGADDIKLRTGIWSADAEDPEEVCVFDPTRPVWQWPQCASPMVVDKASYREMAEMEPSAMVLAPLEADYFVSQERDSLDDGNYSYRFHLVRINELDEAGRARRVGFDFLLCGLPPEEGAKNPDGTNRYLTRNLYPGVTADGEDCRPNGKEGLMAVARANLGRLSLSTVCWVRDPRPGEVEYIRERDALSSQVTETDQSTIAE